MRFYFEKTHTKIHNAVNTPYPLISEVDNRQGGGGVVGMNLTVYARYVTMLYSGTVHLNSRGEHCTLNSGGGGALYP